MFRLLVAVVLLSVSSAAMAEAPVVVKISGANVVPADATKGYSTATSFVGPGTGLTGTAAALSIGGNAATASVAPAGALSGTTLNPTVVTSSLTSVGTITAGQWTGTPIAITSGGTGSTSQGGARTALGSTAVGDSLFTLTNPGAITFLRVNADNSVTALSASAFRTAIGSGTGSGDALIANPLSQFAATTSAQLSGVLSDENGTGGGFVRATGSTIDLTTATALPLATGVTGTLLAAQFPALTGNVTTTAGSLVTTIGAAQVTLAMQANMATGSLVYRKTAGAGAPEINSLATLKTDLLLTGTNSGDQTTITGNAGTATALATGRTLAITGDIAWISPAFDGGGNVTAAGTLAAVNSNVGSFGGVTQASVVTVNAKGLVTAASNSTITPAVGSITGLGTGVGTALAVNVGSAGAPVTLNGSGGTPSSLTGTNITGTAAGLSIGGNAATASVAPAGALSGTALNPTVVTSSLTSVGTITGGTWAGTAIAIANGGTGSTSQGGARTALGSTAVGDSLFTLANPGAVTFVRLNADNSVTALSALAFRTAIGSGTGSGDALIANPLSQFAATTSAQLSGVLSDENGTGGGFVRATGSTIDLTTATGLPLATGVTGTLLAAQFPALTGPITTTAGGLATSIASQTGTGTTFAMSASPTFSGTLTTPALTLSTGSGSSTILNLYNTTANAANRNWAIVTTITAYGDFDLRTSTAPNGNPVSEGTSRLYIDAAGAVTMPSSLALGVASTTTGSLILYGSGGANSHTIKGATTPAASNTYTWPAASPTAGQVLSASAPAAGIVTMSWATVGGGSQTPWTSNIDAATFTLTNTGKIGAFTSSPTNDFSFGGNAARTLWMERHATANTAGNSLTIQSGGATSGATDKSAGDLLLKAGLGTGNAALAQIAIMGPAQGGATGTTDKTLVNRFVASKTVALTSGTAATVASLTVANGSMSGGMLFYLVEATDGTDYIASQGSCNFAVVNKAGTYTWSTMPVTEAANQNTAKSNAAQSITNAFSGASGSLKLTSTMSGVPAMSPTTFRVTYSLISNSAQAIAL